MTRVICTAVPHRAEFVKELQTALPHMEVIWDSMDHPPGVGVLPNGGSPIRTFLKALRHAGPDPVIFLEDDALPALNFTALAEEEIACRPDTVVTFYWGRVRRVRNVNRPRLEPSSGGWAGNVGFYLPPGAAADILTVYPTWGARVVNKPDLGAFAGHHHQDMDNLLACWLKQRRLGYHVCVPSLVDHRSGPSSIDPSRQRTRRTHLFVDDQ